MTRKFNLVLLEESRRDRAIERLVIDCVGKRHTFRCTLWMQLILENGFLGCEKMTHEQLQNECSLRGVKWEDDFFDDPTKEEFDDDEEDDDEVRGLSARSIGSYGTYGRHNLSKTN